MLGRRAVAAVVLLALIATGCASGPTPSPSIAPVVGGTLRIGVSGGAERLAGFAYVDPAKVEPPDVYPWLAGCCLARTLLTYPGRVAADGGTVLQPDLATELPEISRDGLTWTFRLRPGIRYAPPYDDRQVEARDIIHTVERNARLEPALTEVRADVGYGYVVGAADYAAGNAPNIAGLSAPDAHTLVVRLTEPFGAFGVLVADFAWSPQPPEVLEGHDDDLGRHWVSTGPYMYETYPAPESGGSPTLVRNPSWQRDTDPRRGAWVGRIELVGYEEPEDGFGMIERGEFDIGDWPLPGSLVDRYRTDPSFEHRLREASGQYLVWISLNLAVPPFDDVAVRRAVNLVVDRAAVSNLIVEGRSDPGFPQPAAVVSQHTFPDSLTGGLLLGYAPFESPGNHGDLAGARAEMAGSRYDTDGDGMCDASACRGIVMPAAVAAAGAQLAEDLSDIGIEVAVVELEETNHMLFPANRTALQVWNLGWAYNLTGSDLAQQMRGGPGMTHEEGLTLNFSLVGASREQLTGWGYEVVDVPSVDDLLAACDVEVGHRRARCWATFDQYVTEVIAPWVPLFSRQLAWLSSDRVASFSLDQSVADAWVAIDQVSLTAEAAR